MTVSFSTAIRLKEAGFPQPEPTYGQAWVFSFLPDTPILIGAEIGSAVPWSALFHAAETFCPAATDILAHLPGWCLSAANNGWICYFAETGYDDFVGHSNPAEACAEAWFFEQAHKKNTPGGDT